MILVVGASGMLGGRLARRLLEHGHHIRALSRTPGKLDDLGKRGVEVTQEDLRDPASLDRACAGVRQVFQA